MDRSAMDRSALPMKEGTTASKNNPHDPIITLLDNAGIASYRAEPKGTGSFTLFPDLPSELRIKIWHHALSIPRIVEMDDTRYHGRSPPDGGVAYMAAHWHFRNQNPPPLLSTCSESRNEALNAYKEDTCLNDMPTSIGGPDWFRFNRDILHLKTKDMDFTDLFVKEGHRWENIRRWGNDLGYFLQVSSDKWDSRPDIFNHVRSLSINRDLFISTEDNCECIIRHFFPNLQLLILLIDDEFDIEDMWYIQNEDFKEYEDDWDDFQPRWAFTNACTGPYKILIQNETYGYYVDEDMEKRFKREEEDYEGYVAPLVMVMECSLPPGLKIPSCGRLPHGYGSSHYDSDDSNDEDSDCARSVSQVSSGRRSPGDAEEESEDN
jgi:hypothetical protein